MDLDFLETFYRAAMLRSVAQAAQELNISASTALYRIRMLERDVGVCLADRTRPEKQFRLTQEGKEFVPLARRLLDLQSEILKQVKPGKPRSLRLRLGAIESVLHSWLVPLIESLVDFEPTVEFDLTVETTNALIELVETDGLDVVFTTRAAVREGTRSRALASMSMAFVGPSRWESADASSLEELATLNLLTFQPGSMPHANLLDVLRQEGVDGARVHGVSSISAMVRLVASGFGIATLPLPTMTSFVPSNDLRVLRCKTSLEPLPIYASWRDGLSPRVAEELVARSARLSSGSSAETTS